MATLEVLHDLPGGYFVEESTGGVLALHGDVARALHEAGYGPESDGAVSTSLLAGRRPLYELRVGDECFLVRRFSHGGLMRWITGRRFFDAERPFRELILSDSLRRVGIRTPQVLAARASSAGLGWRLEVMTRRIDDTTDLGFVLGMLRRGEVERSVLRPILVALGELVRRLHLHGYLHADLQPNNVLVNRGALEGQPPELWLLDLDRSYFCESLGDGERRSNLARLYRHVARRDAQHGKSLTWTDYASFLRGYDPDRTRWKEDWPAIRARHAAGLGLHRVGWMLERVFGGPRKDPRTDGDLLVPHPQRGSSSGASPLPPVRKTGAPRR